MADVASSYNEHFEVVRADTPQQLDLAYRLRYQVYCVENPFEDPARCPDGREIDEDDHRSVHTLLIHRRSGVAAGTSRLIMPRLDGEGPLPIQRIVGRRKLKSVHRVPLHRIAEISRFAVSKDFRRRCGEARYPDAGFPYPPSAIGYGCEAAVPAYHLRPFRRNPRDLSGIRHCRACRGNGACVATHTYPARP